MKYLYLWKTYIEGTEDYIYNKPLNKKKSDVFNVMGPFKSNKDAKNSWILLGRKTNLKSVNENSR